MLDLQNKYVKKMIYYIILNATIQDLDNLVGILKDSADDDDEAYQ